MQVIYGDTSNPRVRVETSRELAQRRAKTETYGTEVFRQPEKKEAPLWHIFLCIFGCLLFIAGIFMPSYMMILVGIGIMGFPALCGGSTKHDQPVEELPEEARRMLREDEQIELTKQKYVKGEISLENMENEVDRIMGKVVSMNEDERTKRLEDQVRDEMCAEYGVPKNYFGTVLDDLSRSYVRKDWQQGGRGGPITFTSGAGGYPPQIQTKITPNSIASEKIEPMDEPYPMEIIPMLQSMGIPVNEL